MNDSSDDDRASPAYVKEEGFGVNQSNALRTWICDIQSVDAEPYHPHWLFSAEMPCPECGEGPIRIEQVYHAPPTTDQVFSGQECESCGKTFTFELGEEHFRGPWRKEEKGK